MDRILLSQLDGLSATGQYAIGTRFASVLLLVAGALGTAYTPFLFSTHAADPDHERAVRGRLIVYAAVVFLTVALALTLFSREIANVIAPGYGHAYRVVGILCLSAAAFGLTPIAAAGIGIARQNRYIAWYTLCALVLNVALCLLLIPPFGLVGAAFATSASNIGLCVAYFDRSQRLVPAEVAFGKLIRAFLLTAALMPLGLLHLDNEALTALLKIAGLPVLVMGFWAVRVLGPEETSELRRAARRVRRRPAPAS
jgi:O-antigen/teichoic acid export membrane protein